MDYDRLIAQLRDDSPAHQTSDKRSAADAITKLRAERDALAALLREAKRYREVLRKVFFLEHNEREWESLEDCQFWAKQECDAIDTALAAHKEGR